MKNFGLNPLPKDSRDITLGQVYFLPDLNELPDEFDLGETRIEDQKDSDFCTAFASTSMSELQEGVQLSPEWQFAMSKQLSGDVEGYGQDLRTICKTFTKFGSLNVKDAPYSLKDKSYRWLRDPKNWDESLKDKALKYKKESYVYVSGKYDAFDTIRAFIWKFEMEKKAVLIGTTFGWDLSQVIMEDLPQYGGGHAMFVRGWKKINGELYLKVVNSYGTSAGENGVHYFSRTLINKSVDLYGAFALTDIPREDIESIIKDNTKTPVLNKLWITIRNFVKSVLKLFVWQ